MYADDVKALAAKVAGCMFHADDAGPVSVGTRFPARPDGEYLTTFECDCIDWGIALGIAWAIGRVENPYSSVCTIDKLAVDAAVHAYGKVCDHAIFTEQAYLDDRAARPNALEVK